LYIAKIKVAQKQSLATLQWIKKKTLQWILKVINFQQICAFPQVHILVQYVEKGNSNFLVVRHENSYTST
jgi:hypothetical protein